MSESPYNINYLLEAELAQFSVPAVRPEKVARGPAASASDAEATQAAMARELLNIDAAHEELIRQYMQIVRHPS